MGSKQGAIKVVGAQALLRDLTLNSLKFSRIRFPKIQMKAVKYHLLKITYPQRQGIEINNN